MDVTSSSRYFCDKKKKAVIFYLEKQFDNSLTGRTFIIQLLSAVVFILNFIYDIIQFGDEYDEF